MSRMKGQNGCLVLFSLPFAGAGVFMLSLIATTIWQSHTFSQWPTVPARILEAELKFSHSSDGTTERATARYEYEWEGVLYEGDRVSTSKGSDNVGSFHKRKADTLKAALRQEKRLDVHVNPANPAESILYPEIRWEMIGFYGVFSLVFGGAGFGLMIFGLRSGRQTAVRKEREVSSPGEPWTWKPEWASGEIKSGGKTGAVVITVFAVVWNLVSLPVLFAFQEEFIEKGNRMFAIALLFPLVGVFLFIAMAYMWIRYRKYGACTFVMQKMPGVIGGRLMGAIRIPKGIQAEDGVEVTLRNVRRITTGSGKHRNTREAELWLDSRRLSNWRTGPTGESLLPVLFDIPYDTEPFHDENPDNKVLWCLKAEAKTPGVDFHAEFEVPVFRTPESDPGFVPSQAPGDDWKEPDVLERLWAEEHIRVEMGPMGPTRLVFPLMRHKGYVIGLLILTLIWNGIVAGLWISSAPRFFAFAFGFFGLIMIIGTLQACLTRQVLDLRPGQLDARGGLLGLSGPRTFSRDHLASLTSRTTTSQGNTRFYTLRVTGEDGKARTLASLIKGKKNADRLLAYLRDTCGVS